MFLFASQGGAEPSDVPPVYPPYPPYSQYPPYPDFPPYPEPYPNLPPDPNAPAYPAFPPNPIDPLKEQNTHGSQAWSWEGQLGTSVIDETHSTTLLLSPQIAVSYNFLPLWKLTGFWGFGLLVDSQGLGEVSARAGNPLLAVGYGKTQPNYTWETNFGVTFPLVRIPSELDGRLYTFLVNQNLAMNGIWNAWFWVRDFIAFPIQGRLRLHFPKVLPMTVAGAIAPLMGVRKQKSDQDLMAQISIAIELAFQQRIHFSPRYQLVRLPLPSVDHLQSAAALRVSYQAKSGDYFIEVLFNLDKPLGMFHGLERWGLWFGKGMEP